MTDLTPLMDEFVQSVVYDAPIEGWEDVELDNSDEDELDLEEKHLAGKHKQKDHGRLHDEHGFPENPPVQATPTQKKKFAEAIKERYDTDENVRLMCDVLSWFTQSEHQEVRNAADALLSGDPKKWFIKHEKAKPRLDAKTVEQHNADAVDEVEAKWRGEWKKGSPAIYLATLGSAFDIFGNEMSEKPQGKDNPTLQQTLQGTKMILAALDDAPTREATEDGPTRGFMLTRRWVQADEIVKHGVETAINLSRERMRNWAKMYADEGTADNRSYNAKQRKNLEMEQKREEERMREFGRLIEVGNEFDASLLSFTHDRKIGVGFARGTTKGSLGKFDEQAQMPVLIKVVGPYKGLDISLFSPFRQSETLLSGRFRVKRVRVHDSGGYFDDKSDWTEGFYQRVEEEKKHGSYSPIRPGSLLIEIEQVSSHGRIK